MVQINKKKCNQYLTEAKKTFFHFTEYFKFQYALRYLGSMLYFKHRYLKSLNFCKKIHNFYNLKVKLKLFIGFLVELSEYP